MLVVSGPRIGWVWIEPCLKFVEQIGVGAFPRVVLVELVGYGGCLIGINHGTAGHSIGTRPHRGKVGGNPVWGGSTIGVGGQKHAVGINEASCVLHGQPPGRPCSSIAGRESMDQKVQTKRQGVSGTAGQRFRPIGAVIQQQQHAERGGADLVGESGQAFVEAILFVLDRNRDHDRSRFAGIQARFKCIGGKRIHRSDDGDADKCFETISPGRYRLGTKFPVRARRQRSNTARGSMPRIQARLRTQSESRLR